MLHCFVVCGYTVEIETRAPVRVWWLRIMHCKEKPRESRQARGQWTMRRTVEGENFPKTKIQLVVTEVLPIAIASRGVVTGKREPRKSAAKYVQHKGVKVDAAPSQLPPEGPLWAKSLRAGARAKAPRAAQLAVAAGSGWWERRGKPPVEAKRRVYRLYLRFKCHNRKEIVRCVFLSMVFLW
jgi:hypothetical protein